MHQDFEDMEGEIDRAIQLGLKGVKIHPDTQKVNMDDPRLMRLYEIIEGRLPSSFIRATTATITRIRAA